MLEINEGGGDQERNEDPVDDRDRPRKGEPDREKKEGCQQLHREIAESDFAPAARAFPAQQQPAEEAAFAAPWDWFLTRRTKRAARLVDRKMARQPVNADVERQTDRGAGEKAKPRKRSS